MVSSRKSGFLTLWVDIEGLLSRDRMCSHDWVLTNHRFSSSGTIFPSRSIDLLDTRVRCLEAVESFLESVAQSIVRLDLVGKECISTRLGHVQDVQERGSRGLFLIRHVAVPCHGTRSRLEELFVALVSRASVHEMNLWVTSRSSGSGMDMEPTKVPRIVESLVDRQVGEILISESNDFSLGNETC